jgi:hypothetical protein
MLWKTWQNINDLICDRRMGIQTRARIEVDELDLPADIALHARRYQATHYSVLSKTLTRYKPHCGGLVFCDVGCGMGRALLYAFGMGF